jgi:glutamine amidotransferase PdxT
MGLIGTSQNNGKTLWDCIREFSATKPTWGTCAGMILLAEKCVGASAVIENGQSLIGGVDITVCRNYFGSQISSFEMATPPPPLSESDKPFPGIFIRAPAILSAGKDVEVLGKVTATPCRQAAITLQELERKIAAGENVVETSLEESSTTEYNVVMKQHGEVEEEKKDVSLDESKTIVLPGAAEGTNAREVICAVRKGNLLCTAFHPELITDDHRWHDYFLRMVKGG